MISVALAKHLHIIATFVSIFAVILTLGSVVTLSYVSNILDRASETDINQANSVAQAAAEEAAKANEAAAVANKSAEETRSDNIKLQIELEKEKSNRLELEGKLGKRNLTYKIAKNLTESLAVLPKFNVKIYTSLNPERISLGRQLASCIEAAGKPVIINERTMLVILGAPTTGVYINIKEDQDGLIASAFEKLGTGYHIRNQGEATNSGFSHSITTIDTEYKVVIHVLEKVPYIG